MNARTVLRRLTLPAAIVLVLVTVLTLLARVVGVVAVLVADIAERLADAGDAARLTVHTTSAAPTASYRGTR